MGGLDHSSSVRAEVQAAAPPLILLITFRYSVVFRWVVLLQVAVVPPKLQGRWETVQGYF